MHVLKLNTYATAASTLAGGLLYQCKAKFVGITPPAEQ